MPLASLPRETKKLEKNVGNAEDTKMLLTLTKYMSPQNNSPPIVEFILEASSRNIAPVVSK